MSNKDFSSVQQRKVRDIDAGLQAHMCRIYNIMTLGLVVTAVSAFLASNVPGIQQVLIKGMSNPFMSLAIGISPFLIIGYLFSPQRIHNKSMSSLTAGFVGVSAYWGILLSIIFMIYAPGTIVKTFFVTASTFAVMSVWGYTTKRDLTAMGSFLAMGALGLFIAIIVNLFLQSPMIHMIISAAGVIIYTLMMAWDTQYVKEAYSPSAGDHANNRLAMMGAVRLYINFIMLFQFLLQFMGGRD